MPRKMSSLLNDLSTTDLKWLLAARERIDVLEVTKAGLVKELAKVEKELDKLMSDAARAGAGATRKVRRKKVAKKAARKTGKKATRKKVAGKKVVKKKVVRRKAAGKKSSVKKAPVKKRAKGRASGTGKMKLEDVIVKVIKKHGSPMAFQDLKARILKGKLFKTKSGNFDNVLRRTLSTSKAVKRVGRGIYDLA